MVKMRGLVVFALVAGCSAAGAFACEDDDDCAGADGGACEPTGFCSFPDEECGSGRRYGQWAGDGLAMACVPDDVASGSTGTATGDGDTVLTLTSSDPTTLTTATNADTGETTSPIDPDSSTSMVSPTGTDDTATTGEPLDPDLVAWYRFEEDDYAGTVIDEVGLHDGTCGDQTCPVPIMGVDGNAAGFDGIDDIVHVATSDLLQVGAELTVALWVRMDTADMDFVSLAAKAYLDMTVDTWELGCDGSGNLEFWLATMTTSVGVGTELPGVGTWFHVAGVWDGETVRFYLDGALVAEDVVTQVAQDDHGVTLGAGNDFGVDENFLHGALDEVRIYRRALVDDEVAALASGL